jgi:putative sterol carrier protein
MADITIAELMGKMPKAFDPEKAKGVDTILQFKFTGKEAGDWFAVIKDGTVNVEQGVHPSPKMTLSADSDDYIALFTGKMDPMQAFMQGKLKLQGDLNQAMKMTQYFKMR